MRCDGAVFGASVNLQYERLLCAQRAFMTCKSCATNEMATLNGEVAIHFPGFEGLDKDIVWVFPKLMVCLQCRFVEFVLPDEQREQLKKDSVPALLPQ